MTSSKPVLDEILSMFRNNSFSHVSVISGCILYIRAITFHASHYCDSFKQASTRKCLVSAECRRLNLCRFFVDLFKENHNDFLNEFINHENKGGLHIVGILRELLKIGSGRELAQDIIKCLRRLQNISHFRSNNLVSPSIENLMKRLSEYSHVHPYSNLYSMAEEESGAKKSNVSLRKRRNTE